MPMKRVTRVKALRQPKPKGTRCYVPGYVDEGAQFIIDQSQLGVAPAVVGAGLSLATGGRVLGVSFKKPSPRVFGGPLVSTVEGFKSRIGNGDVSAVMEMDNARKTAKDKSAWQRIWNEMLPTWRIGSAAVYERIKQLDPSLPIVMPVSTTPQTGQPAQQPITVTQPVVQQPPPSSGGGGFTLPPINISIPAAPSGTLPVPPSSLPGGEPQVPEEVAKPVQAGIFGGDSQMGKLMLAGAGLFIISQFMGKRR